MIASVIAFTISLVVPPAFRVASPTASATSIGDPPASLAFCAAILAATPTIIRPPSTQPSAADASDVAIASTILCITSLVDSAVAIAASTAA